MSHVFISYDRADAPFVERLTHKLETAGISTWRDMRSLTAGDDWRRMIEEAIQRASAIIVVLTPASKASEYVSYEWACGLGAGIRVIPLLLEAAEMPKRLAALHCLDFTRSGQEPWEKLIRDLQKALASPQTGSAPAAPGAVQNAEAALDSLDAQEQAAAVKALAQMEHPSAREALAGAVRHPSREVRIRAALELSRFKDTRAVPGLIEAQRWWQLRWEFVRRITAIGAPAVPALIEALQDDDAELREYAAHALGELEAESAVAALKSSAEDPVDKVRDASAKALAKLRQR